MADARELAEEMAEEAGALRLMSYTGDGRGGWTPDLGPDDIDKIATLLALGSRLMLGELLPALDAARRVVLDANETEWDGAYTAPEVALARVGDTPQETQR